jgi:hypothetical protein
MGERVFFSFHYKADCVRAGQIRNMGVVEGNPAANDNDWESITRGGDIRIMSWIDEQMKYRPCTVVLIGTDTAGRKWINYEIRKTWADHKGLFGIYVHNLLDFGGRQSARGRNPFEVVYPEGDIWTPLSRYVMTHDPPYNDSKQVYKYISDNIATWIAEAIAARRARA